MRVEVSMLSRTGARERNEDALGVWSHGGLCFCVLADGAGGLGGGDRAAQLAVGCIVERLREQPACDGHVLRSALEHANAAVVAAQRADARFGSMRTTALVLAVDTDQAQAMWAHVGDTRLYCFRAGVVAAQTADHSVVQEMVAAGYMRPDQLRHAPLRSQLLGALGASGELAIDVQDAGFALQPGDAFLLCTDGCWEPVQEADMAADLQQSTAAADWLQRIEQRILAQHDARQDNYSAIALLCLNREPAGPEPDQ